MPYKANELDISALSIGQECQAELRQQREAGILPGLVFLVRRQARSDSVLFRISFAGLKRLALDAVARDIITKARRDLTRLMGTRISKLVVF